MASVLAENRKRYLWITREQSYGFSYVICLARKMFMKYDIRGLYGVEQAYVRTYT